HRSNPLETIKRLIGLINSTLSVEQIAYYLVDYSNQNFICIGDHRNAHGFCSSFNHPLLSEILNAKGSIIIRNKITPEKNDAYDVRCDITTKNSMGVPLMNFGGEIKAILHILNRLPESSTVRFASAMGNRMRVSLLHPTLFLDEFNQEKRRRSSPSTVFFSR
ncbi:hypothetical protein IE077_000767, partial [Cardiosporidium cionae]